MKIQSGYTFKGVTYLPDYDYEDDNMKIFHTVEIDTYGGSPVISTSMDWSPYSTPTMEEFQTWVNLGMPKSSGTGSLDRDDLIKLLQEKQ